ISFYEEAGPGLVVFHPKGFIVREELIKLVREVNTKLGYEEVYTPHVYRALVWIRSGHYEHYKDKMILAKIEGEEYGVKPMNCPGHILIYKSEPRSYRDLPVRFSEFGTVYRWEKRGELYGLLRVRGFTQDDGHSFLREDQVKEEVKRILKAVQELLAIFGFGGEDVRFNLSTRPDEYIGSEEMWEKATRALREALEELQLPYTVREKEGAFYGPKIDVEFRDSLGRWWQCSTIQVDFALPERFNLEYTMPDGSKARPVVVHRALLGSIERFMAILLEHFEGKLPTWLSPVQVVVLPTSDKYADYARKVVSRLRELGLRAELWAAEETLGRRIKRAYDMAVPYIVVVGGREAETESVSIRGRGNLRVDGVPLEEFASLLAKEVSSRCLNQEALLSLMAKRGLKVEGPGGPDASGRERSWATERNADS
ncbi:MAG TPA: threonine--tRNA ligase, partial [Chromatiaceae bacterium]|nr:threonine--tRNA ligase [Chromatiaceae bacterium]